MNITAFWDTADRTSRLELLAAWFKRLREPSLTLLVGLQALVIFVVEPLEAMRILPGFLIGILTVATVCIVLVLASANRWAQAAIILSALIDGTSWVLSYIDPSLPALAIDFVGRLIFFIAVSAILLHVIFGDEDGTYHRIQGGIAVYLNIALVFAFLYRIADLFDPHAFRMLAGTASSDLSRFIYFSLTTLTTTGYGDVVPVNPLVRSAANLESLIGQLFTVTLLARLVSLYFASARKSDS
jgi:Ion channel